MSRTESFLPWFGGSTKFFTKKESVLLEMELLLLIYEELRLILVRKYEIFFKIFHFNKEMEYDMTEKNLMQFIINELLVTNEYTIEGISLYTHTPRDIIYDLILGKNIFPSVFLVKKIITLHRKAFPKLYQNIINKIKDIPESDPVL